MDEESTIKKLPEWKNLFDAVLTWEYGSIHTHDEIGEILDIPYGDHRYYEQVNRAKRELIDVGRAIINVQYVGYKLIEPGEYVPHSSQYVKKGTQKIIEGERVIICAPSDLMTLEERNNADRHREDLTALRVLITPKAYSIIRASHRKAIAPSKEGEKHE